jgi:hypothetical protein
MRCQINEIVAITITICTFLPVSSGREINIGQRANETNEVPRTEKLQATEQEFWNEISSEFKIIKEREQANNIVIESLKLQQSILTKENERQSREIASLKLQQSIATNQRTQEIESLKLQQSILTGQLTKFFSELSSSNGTEAPIAKLQIEATGGVTYVRWGRNVCEGDATPVYIGYAAGSLYNGAGGAADKICLHNIPQFSTAADAGATLYGVEYRRTGGFRTDNNWGLPLLNNDMPCVVCHVQARTHQLMIPAREVCPAGWTREYWGYLMSTGSTHSKGSYSCVDEAPESVPGGSAAVSARLEYTVKSSCTALPCPPYVTSSNNLKCVVCSK